jgi:membrane protease YdiL (CAAX protease family)
VAGTTEVARQRALALAALLVLAAGATVPLQAPPGPRLLVAGVGLVLAAAALARPGPAAAVAVLAAAIEAWVAIGAVWQLALPLALGTLGLAMRHWPVLVPLRVPRGEVPPWPTFACAAVTPLGLTGWVALLRPDVSDITTSIPDLSPALLVLGALAFSGLNALGEEWVWRGVFQSRLQRLFPPAAAVALQAASFGAAHAHGFPRGAVGVVLAGAWGALLGLLRMRAGGLLAPVLAHVVADATIAALVLLWLR